jgi:HK97 family phage portal protein
MTASEFWEMLMGHLCLRGNGYAYVERDAGEVVALWPLHPDRVTIEVSDRRLIYVYQSDGREVKYPMDSILHIRGLSSDGIVGYSPLTLCRETFASALAIREYSAKYFRNDASPGGLLTTPAKLSEAAYKNLRESWTDGHAGSGNAHKVAILDADLKWQAIGVTPEDSQMIDS